MEKITLEVKICDSDLKTYGKEGYAELLKDILERYGNAEYFEPYIVVDILERRENKD